MPRNKFRPAATAFCVFAILAITGCGAEQPVKPAGPGFTMIVDDAVVSEAKLAAAMAPFFEDPILAETRALVIMRGGRVVAERYAPGYGPDSKLVSWSMAKSVTAVLVGMMVADGRASVG